MLSASTLSILRVFIWATASANYFCFRAIVSSK